MPILFIILLLSAYLIGSINCAIITCKLFRLSDPRNQGSKNPGTTNVLRLGGKKAAAIVLVGDLLKGIIPVLISKLIGIDGWLLAMIGFAAVAGHIYPLFFQFQGGKGVATSIGVIFTLSFWLGIIWLSIFLIIVLISRYVSLSSLCAIIITPFFTFLLNYSNYFLPLLLIALLVTWHHQENLQRLKNGTENKLRF